jgi:hypothetical protein
LDCFRKANAEAGIHVDLAPYKGRDMKGGDPIDKQKKKWGNSTEQEQIKILLDSVET